MESVALRYATSLFEIAQEEKSIERYESELNLIKDVICLDEQNMAFFTHFNVSKEAKKETLDKGFKNNVSPYVLNFVKLLIDKNRMHSILEIISAFHTLTNDYLGIKEGTLYTSELLDKDQILKIEAAMSRKMNAKVTLNMQVDESLIGGIKVVIGNHVVDGSIKNKMDLLKNELLRK